MKQNEETGALRGLLFADTNLSLVMHPRPDQLPAPFYSSLSLGTQVHKGDGDLYKTTSSTTTKKPLVHTKAHLANEWNINDYLTVAPLAGRN